MRGFDPDMVGWGVEDSDFGLRCWSMGVPILTDPRAIIGHRFRTDTAGASQVAVFTASNAEWTRSESGVL